MAEKPASRREATAFVLFQIQQLHARNAAHEFEHLCRQYARVRIDPTVIPATGPVSAGGDGGRDFESLLSFNGELDAPGKRNVFACTLQQTKLSSKIRSDLRAIVQGGSVKAVYYFCAVDLVVSVRHKIQNWARTDLSIDVDFIDLQALAEHLVEPDLCWIAEEYLSVSRDLLPRFASGDSHYDAIKSVWFHSESQINSFEDFVSVRFGLRRSTRGDTPFRSDAPTWIRLLKQTHPQLPKNSRYTFQVAYEIITGTFFLEQRVEHLGELIRETLHQLPNNTRLLAPGELRDYLTILGSTAGQNFPVEAGLSEDVIMSFRAKISSLCDDALKNENRPSRRCEFLNVSALLRLFDPKRTPEERESSGLMALDEILTLSKEARFFNVHALADALVQLVPTLGKSRRFQAICRGFDHIVAERCGSQAAAKLALARALRLHENDRPWEAIRELHRAKGAWFHGESIDDCIRAFATLSSLYSQEGLHLAALYYALAGISIANESHSVQSERAIPDLLLQVLDCRESMGQSVEVLQAADVALRFQQLSDSVQSALIRYLTAYEYVRQHEPRLSRLVRNGWQAHPAHALFLANERGAQQVVDELLADGDRPNCTLCADCGSVRVIEWNAFDTVWIVSTENNPSNVAASESIGAMLQILLAEMFDEPSWNHVGTIRIEVAVEDSFDFFDVSPIVDGLKLKLGRNWWHDPEKLVAEFAQLVSHLIPRRDLLDVFERMFAEGLGAKLLVGAPYPVLRQIAMLRQRPVCIRSRTLASISAKPSCPVPSGLTSKSLRLPGHEGQEWEAAISHRYNSWIEKVGPCLAAISAKPIVAKAIDDWRSQSVPDWHIVGALGSLIVSLGVAQIHEEVDPDKAFEYFRSLPAAPLPSLVKFNPTRDELEASRASYLAAFLVTEGVDLDSSPWPRERFEIFARVRLGFDEQGPKPPNWQTMNS